MSPISLCLNLFLATLLLLTLTLGWRLNKQLKTLREGQAGFATAVADLDRAASRAERGLADLRAATDEAVEFLAGRIDKGRELAAKLERLTATAAATSERAPSAQIAAVERLWAKPANEPVAEPQAAPRAAFQARPQLQTAAPLAREEAAAEALALKLTDILEDKPAGATVQQLSPRSRAVVDDDLFDMTPRMPARAFGGGR